MENYDNLGRIGEGTYGVVLKCRHRETGALVAVKKFKESDDDEQVRKTALREVRVLKQLAHPNVVSLHDVFRRRGKLYLVFEYVERTILEDLERRPAGTGLEPLMVKRVMWQLVRAVGYCHSKGVVHRDIKPENLLISRHLVLKLCDFGFARHLVVDAPRARYSDYVATRWYRAPELLVGDQVYGPGVDIWAIGCMFAEMWTGQPLFPGESDVDQLWLIFKTLGRLCSRHEEMARRPPAQGGVGMARVPQVTELEPLERKLPGADAQQMAVLKACLRPDPADRPSCDELLRMPYFASHAAEFERSLLVALDKDAAYFSQKRRKKVAARQHKEAAQAAEAMQAQMQAQQMQPQKTTNDHVVAKADTPPPLLLPPQPMPLGGRELLAPLGGGGVAESPNHPKARESLSRGGGDRGHVLPDVRPLSRGVAGVAVAGAGPTGPNPSSQPHSHSRTLPALAMPGGGITGSAFNAVNAPRAANMLLPSLHPNGDEVGVGGTHSLEPLGRSPPGVGAGLAALDHATALGLSLSERSNFGVLGGHDTPNSVLPGAHAAEPLPGDAHAHALGHARPPLHLPYEAPHRVASRHPPRHGHDGRGHHLRASLEGVAPGGALSGFRPSGAARATAHAAGSLGVAHHHHHGGISGIGGYAHGVAYHHHPVGGRAQTKRIGGRQVGGSTAAHVPQRRGPPGRVRHV